MMKYVFAIAIAILLAACNQDAPVMGSAAPQGTYASETGRSTYTFSGGKLRFENKTFGTSDGTFEMVDGAIKVRFENGDQTVLKVKDGVLVDAGNGTKFVKQ